MTMGRIARACVIICAGLLLTACAATPGAAPTPAAPAQTAAPATQSDAAAYCAERGGVVETRYPFYGPESEQPLQLAGSLDVCVFTSAQDGSRIFVALDTLYAEEPTLAALAYLNPPRFEAAPRNTNPSSVYCTNLGGTDLFGGVNATGGGWARAGGEDPIALCIFPDRSTIDSWGLTYHSDGTTRGADLTGLLRFKPPQARQPSP